MDLATIIQQAAILNNTQTQQAEQVAGLMTGASKEASGMGENLQKAAQLKSDAELVRLQGELNTQNARVKVANAFGTNANAQSDVITNMAESMRQTALNLAKAQDNVSRIEANSDLLGNPIGWLEDLLVGDGARAQRDALASAFDVKQKLVTNLNAATQTSVATQNAISETLSQTSIKQMAEATALKGQAEAAEARINAARYGVASIEALQQVGAQNFSRSLSVYNAVKQDEQWRLARADALERRKQQKDIDADVNDMVTRINAYRQTFSLPTVNAAYVKRNWGSGKVGDMLRDQELSGWRILDNGGSVEGALGSKPSDAYFKVKTEDLKIPPAWTPAMDVLGKAEQAFNSSLDQLDPTTGKTLRASLKPEQAKELFDQTVAAAALEEQKIIKHGKGNAYQAPPIEAVLESPTRDAQALKNSNFGKLVLQSLVATGVSDPNPELLMATGMSAFEKGELTLPEVRDGVATYYREAVGLVNATGGFAALNVPAITAYPISTEFLQWRNTSSLDPAEQSSWWEAPWALHKEAARLFGQRPSEEQRQIRKVKTIDLTNTADVTTALTILQATKTADKIISNKGSESQ